MSLWHIHETLTWPDRKSVQTNWNETSCGDEKKQHVGNFEVFHATLPPMPRGTETAEEFLYTAAKLRTMPSPLPAIEVCAEMAKAVLAEIAEGGGPSLERNLDILNRLNEVNHAPAS
jgi:hypothetical protein